MVIRFSQSVLNFRRGGEYELPDGVANVYIRRGMAVKGGLPPQVVAEKTVKKRGRKGKR